MIYVTQGHEKGVGLEIFLKAFLLLSAPKQKEIVLIASPSDLDQNLLDLNLNSSLFANLKIIENSSTTSFSSTNSLLTALSIIKPDDILITMPTSKDQLIYKNIHFAGYTEFFRNFYGNQNISMTFKGLQKNILLITDHIPLGAVTKMITHDLIVKKVSLSLKYFKSYFFEIDEIIFSGINPHAGEKKLLGDEEKYIDSAILKLKENFSAEFRGPYSGDTLHHYTNHKRNQLLVYMYHDQALAQFKAEYGLIGLNITLGLPFLRLSVDHGTAFELYGKNKANISGMLYLFNQAFEVIKCQSTK